MSVGSFYCDPAAVNQAATAATEIGARLPELNGQLSGASSTAVGAHAGFALAGALTEVTATWGDTEWFKENSDTIPPRLAAELLREIKSGYLDGKDANTSVYSDDEKDDE